MSYTPCCRVCGTHPSAKSSPSRSDGRKADFVLGSTSHSILPWMLPRKRQLLTEKFAQAISQSDKRIGAAAPIRRLNDTHRRIILSCFPASLRPCQSVRLRCPANAITRCVLTAIISSTAVVRNAFLQVVFEMFSKILSDQTAQAFGTWFSFALSSSSCSFGIVLSLPMTPSILIRRRRVMASRRFNMPARMAGVSFPCSARIGP